MKVCWGFIPQEARMAWVCGLHTSAAGGAVWDRGEPGDKPVPSFCR